MWAEPPSPTAEGDHECMVRAQTAGRAAGELRGLRGRKLKGEIKKVEVTTGSEVAESWKLWDEFSGTEVDGVSG